VAAVGDPAAEDTCRVLSALGRGFHPLRVTAFKPAAGDPEADKVVPLLAGKTAQGVVTTYMCQGFVCPAPLVGEEAAGKVLGENP
jgi:hypothetical protein